MAVSWPAATDAVERSPQGLPPPIERAAAWEDALHHFVGGLVLGVSFRIGSESVPSDG
jgi:hypothetical protein